MTASGGTGSYSFEWYERDPDSSMFTKVTGRAEYYEHYTITNSGGTSTLTVKNPCTHFNQNGSAYYCFVKSGSETVQSNIVLLTVKTPALEATGHWGSSATVYAGQSLSLPMDASGGTGNYTYEWHWINNKSGNDVTLNNTYSTYYDGLYSAKLTIKNIQKGESGDQYYCIVRDTAGNVAQTSKLTLYVQ